ncbi:phage tail protein [Iodobacter sp. CM08]|uniref:phage tail protein n=1 Tax=Iodobacter sp. CM08 TaxID=3085902 RepID=UPI0029824392|nr:phage tail protein [Iodobacter sp. CM08]MDW5417046.1 phage tail protein [Iodobacter sp. CM08]
MAGEVIHYAGSTPPSGSLLCNGALVSRTAYANLFAAIGILYGAGDGNTTFALPDLRGEFPRFADAGRGIDAARAVGSGQGGDIQGHKHPLVLTEGNQVAGNMVAAQGGAGTLAFPLGRDVATTPSNSSASVGAVGGSETRPRNIALLPCIYY